MKKFDAKKNKMFPQQTLTIPWQVCLMKLEKMSPCGKAYSMQLGPKIFEMGKKFARRIGVKI